jgi:hypothetical protein
VVKRPRPAYVVSSNAPWCPCVLGSEKRSADSRSRLEGKSTATTPPRLGRCLLLPVFESNLHFNINDNKHYSASPSQSAHSGEDGQKTQWYDTPFLLFLACDSAASLLLSLWQFAPLTPPLLQSSRVVLLPLYCLLPASSSTSWLLIYNTASLSYFNCVLIPLTLAPRDRVILNLSIHLLTEYSFDPPTLRERCETERFEQSL